MGVAVRVLVADGVGVGVPVPVRVAVPVRVGVWLRVLVADGVDVRVRVSVAVTDGVRVLVGVRVDVAVRVAVAVRVWVGSGLQDSETLYGYVPDDTGSKLNSATKYWPAPRVASRGGTPCARVSVVVLIAAYGWKPCGVTATVTVLGVVRSKKYASTMRPWTTGSVGSRAPSFVSPHAIG